MSLLKSSEIPFDSEPKIQIPESFFSENSKIDLPDIEAP